MKLTDVEKMMFANFDESDESSDEHNNETIHSQQANQRCVSVRDDGPLNDSNENSLIRAAPSMSVVTTTAAANQNNSRPQRKSKSKTQIF